VAEDQAERARHSYDRLSHFYAWLSDDSERRFVKEAVEGLLKPQPGQHLLEPGFGTGQVLVVLAELVGPDGRVCGIDTSDGMVEQTRRRVADHGLTDRVELLRGDISQSPYPSGSFDGVFMSFTLELFDDVQMPVVLAEIRRVLKPGGRLCVASMSSHGGRPLMEKAYAWSHEHMPSFVDCRPIDGPASIERAGFDVTEHRATSMWGLAVDLTLAQPSTPAR
jgi:ubiquinone/menaquinone biosynthesis C-methylase UbiE